VDNARGPEIAGLATRRVEEPEARRTVTGICGVCAAGCGVNVHLVDGRIDRLTPLKDHPLGIVCPRGMRAREVVYSPDRLLYPQRRVGPRGEGQFERIGWDEAYELWVGALERIAEQHGPEAACIYTGRGNFEFGLNEAFAPAETVESSANAVLFPFGSPNTTGVGSLCYASYGMIAPRACFGGYIRDIHENLDNAELILVWGANPATDSPPVNLRRLKQARARGSRVIVIDHRRTETVRATQADWIGIRPGTDGALALGALRVLLEDGLEDRAFAQRWTHGLGELVAYLRAFTPERVAEITGVPAATVQALARSIAAAKGCAMLTYTGLEYSNTGIQAIRAVWCLQALAGHLDVPGGKLFKMSSRPQTRRILTAPPAGAPLPIGYDEFPLYHAVRREAHGAALPHAILDSRPYPIRGLIISGASLITAWPDPDLWRRALSALDLLVCVNRFPTADSAYADLLLPATTMFEIESYMAYDGYVQLRNKVIEPLGEARNDYLIFAELARRLGYGQLWPQGEAALVEHMLDGTGVTLDDLRRSPQGIQLPSPPMKYRKYESGELRADGLPGFATPTGKFEIASEWLRSYGYDALPVYTEPKEGPRASPELAKRFPLVLNSGARTQTAFRSQHLNVPSLLAQQPLPLVHMYLDDAAAREIVDGDAVLVSSPRGVVRYWASVTDDIVAGTVEVNMGGGGPLGPAEWRDANVNRLTDPGNCDPLSGFPVFKALLCEVTKQHPSPVDGGAEKDLVRPELDF
jgi:anaerobic selenocysteine-containing dehydrogenase